MNAVWRQCEAQVCGVNHFVMSVKCICENISYCISKINIWLSFTTHEKISSLNFAKISRFTVYIIEIKFLTHTHTHENTVVFTSACPVLVNVHLKYPMCTGPQTNACMWTLHVQLRSRKVLTPCAETRAALVCWWVDNFRMEHWTLSIESHMFCTRLQPLLLQFLAVPSTGNNH